MNNYRQKNTAFRDAFFIHTINNIPKGGTVLLTYFLGIHTCIQLSREIV